MASRQQPVINCANCGTPFQADIKQVLDVGQDPSAKTRLISGQVTMAVCPNCGFENQVATPIVYHDPEKELLLINVPMELGMSQDEQETVVGRFIRDISDSLPQEQRKGYLLNPRRTFTLQGMIDTVLEADGITKEMIAERQEKLGLVQQFLQTPPDQLEALVQQHDDKLDADFFAMLTMTAESAMQGGQQDVAQQILSVRDAILPLTSYSEEMMAASQQREAMLQKVSADINAMGDNVTHRMLADLVVKHADDEAYLEIFASAVRPALTYEFFEQLTAIAENDRNKKTRRKAEQARDFLVDVLEVLDQQSQARVQQAVAALQSIAESRDINQAVQQNLGMIDDMFMAVLDANLQDAQQKEDMPRLQRLEAIYQAVNEVMIQNAPPEVRFLNELMMIEDTLEMRLKLVDEAPQYGEDLLRYLEMVIAQLESQGEQVMLERLREIHAEARKVIESE
jgi:hypothetical protein